MLSYNPCVMSFWKLTVGGKTFSIRFDGGVCTIHPKDEPWLNGKTKGEVKRIVTLKGGTWEATS